MGKRGPFRLLFPRHHKFRFVRPVSEQHQAVDNAKQHVRGDSLINLVISKSWCQNLDKDSSPYRWRSTRWQVLADNCPSPKASCSLAATTLKLFLIKDRSNFPISSVQKSYWY